MHELDSLAVAGGDYCVGRWPGGGEPILAVHGITSSHMAWARVANALTRDFDVYAPDLRGRGNSAKLPLPFGFPAHIADLLALLDHYELSSVVYVGHSLGAYIGLDLALAAPDRIRGLVLVDGGIALPLREGKRPEDVIKGVLGPALARLGNVYPTRESYHEFWQTHPAFQDPDGWNDEVRAFADYDLAGEPPNLRSGINADAVSADAYGLLSPGMVNRIDEVGVPTLLLTAPRGLMNQPQPLLPPAAVAEKQAVNANLDVIEIADTNHYSITLGAGAGRVAAAVETFVGNLA
ncbi:MAG: alpha/beta hydrolase [Gammaproteobacteria bacterium]|jgi:pimeloyl-ACP methyl ester carboxylesterase